MSSSDLLTSDQLRRARCRVEDARTPGTQLPPQPTLKGCPSPSTASQPTTSPLVHFHFVVFLKRCASASLSCKSFFSPCLSRQHWKANLKADGTSRESFDNIYLDLSKQSGKCRFADSGLGWRPSGGGDTFTLDGSNIGSAQWSRAARGFELKVLTRNMGKTGIIQLDGFQQEVSMALPR